MEAKLNFKQQDIISFDYETLETIIKDWFYIKQKIVINDVVISNDDIAVTTHKVLTIDVNIPDVTSDTIE